MNAILSFRKFNIVIIYDCVIDERLASKRSQPFSTFSKNIQMFVGSGLDDGLHKSHGLYSDFFGL